MVRPGLLVWLGKHRDGCRVWPESELIEIRIRVLDEPSWFKGKCSPNVVVYGPDESLVRQV